MCPHDWGKKIILGNLKKEKLLDIWFKEKSIKIRKILTNKNRNFSPCNVCDVDGTLMGEKIVLTELIAFRDLSDYVSNNTISERSVIIASYALCGFANFGSNGIQLGGIGSMAPKRKKDLSKLVFKAMIGGAIASWLTASIVGVLI